GHAVARSTLLRMEHTYRRPLLTFYLAAPPARGDRGEDFRRAPDKTAETEPLVDSLVRDIRARQSMVRALIEDEQEARELNFIASVSMDDGVQNAVDRLGRVIAVDRAAFRVQTKPENAFALLRTGAEAAGVFVLLLGNLGSHHTALDTTAFRGFALADP